MNNGMELRIALELDRSAWSVTLRAESSAIGEPLSKVFDLPFSVDDIALFERVLDLSCGNGLKHRFKAEQVARLQGLQLLRVQPSSTDAGDKVLSGCDLQGEQVQDCMRQWLHTLLIEPLQDRIDEHFARQRGAKPTDRPLLYLCLQLRARHDQPLLRLPWELLHRQRLAKGDIYVGRYLLYENSVSDLPEPATQLDLLVLQSEPDGLPPMQLQEREQIYAGLSDAGCGASVRVETIQPAGYAALRDRLWNSHGRPTIVHFAGHGDFGWRCDHCHRVSNTRTGNPCGKSDCGFQRYGDPSGFVAFTDPKDGHADWTDIAALRALLGQLGLDIRLLVLNACNSATSRGSHDVFNGIAQQLMDFVPAVIAAPHPLGSRAAEEFSRLLYRGIGAGMPLFAAIHQAQQLLAHPYPDEWYRQVLYLRSQPGDGGRLLASKTLQDTKPTGTHVAMDRLTDQAVFKIDFSRQEEAFHRHVRQHRGRDTQGCYHDRRNRPMVFVIPGCVDETSAEALLTRLVTDLAQRLGDYDELFAALDDAAIGRSHDLLLNGNESLDSSDRGLATLAGQLADGARKALVNNQSIPTDPGVAEERMRRTKQHRPTVVFAHVEFEALDRSDALAYVQSFCRYWGDWGDQHQLMLVGLFIEYPTPPPTWIARVLHRIRGVSRRARAFDRQLAQLDVNALAPVAGVVLPTVSLIAKNEVLEWVKCLDDDGVLPRGRRLSLQAHIDRRYQQAFAPGTGEQRQLSFRELWLAWSDFLNKTAANGAT